MKREDKGGQVAIFVIIAIVIVGVILVVFLFPRINLFVGDVNPSSFLRNCIEPEVKDSLDVLSKQGGYLSPDNYVMYDGNNVQYLCYTSENYVPCVIQQPLLNRHIESEIEQRIQPIARNCISSLEEQYISQGYTVQTTPGEIEVNIIPGVINIDFLSPMTVSKETTQEFRKFVVNVDSEIYDLIFTANSILEFESELGDSETTLYLRFYPDLKIEKVKRADEGTIYTLSNVVTGDSFTFASRSLNWPEGYALEEFR